MPKARRIAADIDARVRQLEMQGISDRHMADHMIGYIGELHWLWAHAYAADVVNLCFRHRGFFRYVSLTEDISAQRKARPAAAPICRAVSAHRLAKLKRGWLDALRDPPDEAGAQSV